jgi:perosamine synthetase
MKLRHQLAAYSPVSGVDLVAAAFAGASSLEALESMLMRDYAASSVTLTGSGTHALQHALSRIGRAPGKRPLVAVPAFACYDIATAVVGADIDVSAYDIDPSTLGPDAESLQAALGSGVDAVILSPLYGIPFDWSAAADLARSLGVLVIEDSAQGHGASWRGKPFGSLGDVSILSFSRGKGWTGGAGGAILTRSAPIERDLPLAGSASAFKVASMLAAQYVLGRPAFYGIPRAIPGLGLGETLYHEPTTPTSMTPMSAEMALRSAVRATAESEIRKANARMLAEQIPSRLLRITPHPQGRAGYLRFPMLLPKGMRSFAGIASAERLGIAPSYPLPLAKLPVLAARIRGEKRAPGADRLAEQLITLPTHSRLSQRDIARIVAALADL